MGTVEYSIGAVVHKIGLSAHVIRIWERRYQAIAPRRSEGKQRLYSEEEVFRLQLLKKLVDAGFRISHIARQSDEELKALLDQGGGTQVGPSLAPTVAGDFLDQAQRAIRAMDTPGLRSALIYAEARLNHAEILEDLIAPLLHWIGEEWSQGRLSIADEHLAASTLSAFLHQMRERYPAPPEAPGILIATPSGEAHELGALIVSVIAAQEGFRVVYCGSSVPAEEIQKALAKTQARLLALSLVYPHDDPGIHRELTQIAEHWPRGLSVIAGGQACESYASSLRKMAALLVTDLGEMREVLREERAKGLGTSLLRTRVEREARS